MWRLDRHKALLARRVLSGAQAADSPPAPSLVRRLLGASRRRATIAFLVLPDRVLAICAHGLRLDFGVSPVTRLRLRELVGRWHSLAARRKLPPAELREVASELEAALQLPAMLDRLGKRVGALRIIPDDVLHGCPFAVLQHRGRHLVERFALSLGFESMPRERAAAEPSGEALLVAVTAALGRLPALPGVRDELDRVAPVLAASRWRVTRLSDERASKAGLLTLLPAAGLLHIGCHGIFAPDRPDESGLVLMARRGRGETLSVRELSGLDLRRLEHATLSSCWSADNFVLPGRWIIGLPETLYRAGCGSTLASLWEVPDRVAAEFTERFYRNLETHPRDRALQLAQIDCLRAYRDLPGVPPYWAGFCLYGDPGWLQWAHVRGRGRR
jgi:CHAT domain-containing protein